GVHGQRRRDRPTLGRGPPAARRAGPGAPDGRARRGRRGGWHGGRHGHRGRGGPGLGRGHGRTPRAAAAPRRAGPRGRLLPGRPHRAATALAGLADGGPGRTTNPAPTRDLLGTPLPHRGPVTAVAFGPDGRSAVTGSRDGTARLWELAAPPVRPALLRHAGHVRVVAFSPDGRTAVTGGDDGVARLWDAATGR